MTLVKLCSLLAPRVLVCFLVLAIIDTLFVPIVCQGFVLQHFSVIVVSLCIFFFLSFDFCEIEHLKKGKSWKTRGLGIKKQMTIYPELCSTDPVLFLTVQQLTILFLKKNKIHMLGNDVSCMFILKEKMAFIVILLKYLQYLFWAVNFFFFEDMSQIMNWLVWGRGLSETPCSLQPQERCCTSSKHSGFEAKGLVAVLLLQLWFKLETFYLLNRKFTEIQIF